MRNQIKSKIIVFYLLILGGLLSGCDRPLNDPYPEQDELSNFVYTYFSEQPKTLDPARSYSVEESTFTSAIYEPPLQYHYLKRPYQLTPLTARYLPVPKYYDATWQRLPDDAHSEKIFYSIYDIEIKPGIYYQPHPAFARNKKGELIYHHLNAKQMKSNNIK